MSNNRHFQIVQRGPDGLANHGFPGLASRHSGGDGGLMSVFKPARHMSGLLGEILAAAGARDAYPASSRADQYFSELSRLDYTFLLPQRFDQLQVRGLIAEL